MPDKAIECCDCREEFVFSDGEQKFFKQKGFTEPRRCAPCRKKRKAESQARVEKETEGNW